MSILDRCVVLFCCIIEVFLLFDYFNNFFEIKIKRNYIKYAFAVTCIIHFAINMIGKSTLNIILIPIVLWTFVSVIFDSKIGVRLGYFVIAYVIMAGVEFLFIIISTSTSDMLEKTDMLSVAEYIWQAMFVKFLNFIVFLLLKQTSNKSHNRMTNKVFFVYLCVPISTLGMMYTMFYSGIDFNRHLVFKTIMVSLYVFMIVANMLLFYAFQKYTENLSDSTRQQLELLHKNAEIERLTKIAEMNETHNETVHNMSHSLKVIGQLAMDNKNDEIRRITEELTGNLVKREIYEYGNNRILNTILSEYLIKAREKNINYDVYVEPGCILKHIEDIDMVSIMGNLLDNALEAAVKAYEATIYARIFMHSNGKKCVIKIVNDCMGELNIQNGKVISSKNEEGIHGLGLNSVTKTVERYEGVFSYYVENNKFYAILVFPIP